MRPTQNAGDAFVRELARGVYDSVKGRTYYHPTQEGREKQLAARMEEIRKIRAGKRGGSYF